MDMRINMIDIGQKFNKCTKIYLATNKTFRPDDYVKYNLVFLSILILLVFSQVSAQPESRNQFSWFIATNACSGARKCLLGVGLKVEQNLGEREAA